MTDQDCRVQCIACAHYRAGKCHNANEARWWPAGKAVHEVGQALAVLKQDCPGYRQRLEDEFRKDWNERKATKP